MIDMCRICGGCGFVLLLPVLLVAQRSCTAGGYTVGKRIYTCAGITAFPELLVRAFSLRQLPRAEELTAHDLYSALAAIAAANVLLLLVTQCGRTLVRPAIVQTRVNCIAEPSQRDAASSI